MCPTFSLVILLIVCSICMLTSPSGCNSIRPNKIASLHKVAKASPKTQMTSIENAKMLFNNTAFFAASKSIACPFTLKENTVKNRIPLRFYELECQQPCSKCGKSGSNCRQLVTQMEAVFFNEDNSSWTKNITVKAGCNCTPSLPPKSANIRD